MSNLDTFRKTIRQYYRQKYKADGRKYTQLDLAQNLGLHEDELGKRLHGYRDEKTGRVWHLTEENILDIVLTLAKWEALTWEEAVDLLSLMDYPLDQSHWKTELQQHLASSARSVSPTHADRQKSAERLARLRAMQMDRSGILHARLENFVGRQTELIEIEHHVRAAMATGGYITITGPAGQGKSSIIAKLVKTYGEEATAYHFIPFSPGPDYQVTLLRHLMAKLIMKHGLSHWYITSESRPVLYNNFVQMLFELAERGRQEVLFIDGLDQLVEDPYGERDLSFLPTNPPKGIVFVLGSRPNETLHPLVLHKPHITFKLLNLSKHDFSLILAHRGVKLDDFLIDQFYRVMQENALYLDLVAKELAQQAEIVSEEIIKRVSENPENIFTLAIMRLKRKSSLWREVLKPLLGVLLVAQEPLIARHIRQILNIEADQLKEGLSILGGLISDDGRQRYSLFHVKLYDYLRQDEHNPTKEYVFAAKEERDRHKILANWCELANTSVTEKIIKRDPIEQVQREYAQYHYTMHLYQSWDWFRLFTVLDTEVYGQKRLRDNLGRHTYTQDLNIGRRAAAWKGWTLEEGLSLLPRLWRYSLLQCSLASWADAYSEAAFEALLLLGREREARDAAELLTKVNIKLQRLLQIANFLGKQVGQEQECLQVLKRYEEIARALMDDSFRSQALRDLVEVLLQRQQWEWAEAVAYMETGDWGILSFLGEPEARRDIELEKFCERLLHAQQWNRAETVARSIEAIWCRAMALVALSEALARAQLWDRFWSLCRTFKEHWVVGWALARLGVVHAQRQQWEQAKKVWDAVQTFANTIESTWAKTHVLKELGKALAQTQQWEQAETIVSIIEEKEGREEVLHELSLSLAKAQQWERAKDLVYSIQQNRTQAEAFMELGKALAKAQQWEQAEGLAHRIEDPWCKSRLLVELGKALASAGQWKHAARIATTIKDAKDKAKILLALVNALAQEQQWDQAQAFVESLTQVQQDDADVLRAEEESKIRAWGLAELGKALAQAQQWERAEAIAHMLKVQEARDWMLIELGKSLAQAQLRERAETVWTQVLIRTDGSDRVRTHILMDLSEALVQAQQWDRAEEIARAFKDDNQRDLALQRLAKTLIQAHQWERAEAMIRTVKEPFHEFMLIEDLRRALIQGQQWERAQMLTRTERWGLVELGKGLARSQQWEKAEALAHTIKQTGAQAEILAEMSKSLAQAQQWERAELLWAEAERLSHDSSNTQINVLMLLAETLVLMQQWERAEPIWVEAEKLSCAMEKDLPRIEVLENLVQILAQAQQWDRVEALAHTLLDQNWGIFINPLTKLVEVLAHAQQWDLAETIANTIGKNEERAEAQSAICKALIKAQQWEHAQAIVPTIGVTGIKAEVLEILGKALIQAQQWSRVETLLKTFEATWLRVEILAALGKASALAQQEEQANAVWAEAEALASMNEHDTYRTKALIALANSFADAGHYERTLRFIQHHWKQATTKEALISLLPLTYKLFSLQPEIGTALCEAFTWEDTVLES